MGRVWGRGRVRVRGRGRGHRVLGGGVAVNPRVVDRDMKSAWSGLRLGRGSG